MHNTDTDIHDVEPMGGSENHTERSSPLATVSKDSMIDALRIIRAMTRSTDNSVTEPTLYLIDSTPLAPFQVERTNAQQRGQVSGQLTGDLPGMQSRSAPGEGSELTPRGAGPWQEIDVDEFFRSQAPEPLPPGLNINPDLLPQDHAPRHDHRPLPGEHTNERDSRPFVQQANEPPRGFCPPAEGFQELNPETVDHFNRIMQLSTAIREAAESLGPRHRENYRRVLDDMLGSDEEKAERTIDKMITTGRIPILAPALFQLLDNPALSEEQKDRVREALVAGHAGQAHVHDGNGRLRMVLDPDSGQLQAEISYHGDTNQVQYISIDGRLTVARNADGTYQYVNEKGRIDNLQGRATQATVTVRPGRMQITLSNAAGAPIVTINTETQS